MREVAVVYFPSYHPDPLYETWYGPGWSEWELMKRARPLFPGHEQPKIPTWGYFDESDPSVMARQIDLAADHGVTCFLFDWYWYGGQQFLHGALERGFLHAPNRERLKFCLIWANHTWGVFPACRDIFRGPTGAERGTFGQALAYDRPLLPIRHSMEDCERVARFCVEHYFHHPNYLTIDGKPVFSFWHWSELAADLGGTAAVAEAFGRMRSITRAAGFPGLHIMVNIANYENEHTVHCWWPGLIDDVKAAGGDSVYGYNAARTPAFPKLTDDWPVRPYEDVIATHRELFSRCENRGLPFHPVATVGFDNTPRWHPGAALPVDFRTHHYEPIVTGNTPERFGVTVRAALDSIERCGGGSRMLIVNAWNEWTEGCHLLPEKRYGTGYLEALRNAVSNRG